MRKGSTLYSKAELAFLRKHRTLTRRGLHELFVQTFNRRDVTYFSLRDTFARIGLRGGSSVRRINYSKAEVEFLKSYCQMERRKLHALFVEKFGRDDVKYSNIYAVCKRHGLRTGRFGARRLGDERLTADGFVEIKTGHVRADRRQNFVFKHRWLWERQNGPVPAGHKLKCLDGNKANTDPSNWECVPNGVLARLNKRGYKAAPAELKQTIIAMAKLEHIAANRGR